MCPTAPQRSQPARLCPRARPSLCFESPVLAPQTSRPSPALSSFLLYAPIDNGWQLPALRTKVRLASSLWPNRCPSNSVLRSGALRSLPWGRFGLHGAPMEETEDSALGIKSGPAVREALERSIMSQPLQAVSWSLFPDRAEHRPHLFCAPFFKTSVTPLPELLTNPASAVRSA